METRKIQSVGGGTYTVSLPRAWADSEGVEAGDVVNLHTRIDGVLMVQTRQVDDGSLGQVTIPVSEENPAWIEQALRAAYAAGATEVALDSETTFASEQRRAAERTARNLTGVSIVEESDASIVVRTSLDPREVSVRQSLRQLNYVALSMHRDATDALLGDASPERLTGRDEQADRLYALIERSFVRGLARLDETDALGVTRSELYELWLTARELERVADHAEAIAAIAAASDSRRSTTERAPSVSESPPSSSERTSPTRDRTRIETLASISRGIVSDAVGIIVGDLAAETARRVLIDRDRLRESLETSDRKLLTSADPDVALVRSLTRIRRTAECGGNVAELALQCAVRRDDLRAPAGHAGPRDLSPGGVVGIDRER
ncbi:AbrB/MazE/SpoVT family DNA-binding domain-containing protein [Halobellus captivus]|uniref:AbrB/MazE/SpoVT family DNA-binding domain-containing protein n=1 Tax=Halobellus captivus TaxID=2592614 RepID=UPI0011A3EC4B|nr:phosphate uptake regulator PhoU [Halobellus captivus]